MEAERLSSNLLRLARVYTMKIPQSLASLSRVMAKDGALFGRISTMPPGGFTIGKYDETVQRFSNYWPEGLAWPEGISRPEPTERLVQTAWGKPLADRINRTATAK